jgi:hypothetical protein
VFIIKKINTTPILIQILTDVLNLDTKTLLQAKSHMILRVIVETMKQSVGKRANILKKKKTLI